MVVVPAAADIEANDVVICYASSRSFYFSSGCGKHRYGVIELSSVLLLRYLFCAERRATLCVMDIF